MKFKIWHIKENRYLSWRELKDKFFVDYKGHIWNRTLGHMVDASEYFKVELV